MVKIGQVRIENFWQEKKLCEIYETPIMQWSSFSFINYQCGTKKSAYLASITL